jgi:putative sterol carrier protein
VRYVGPVAARAFFEGLAARADAAGLSGVTQTFRFEIEGEGTWRVAIDDGRVAVVENGEGDADATIKASGDVFDQIVSGRQNPAMAYMSGKVKIDGDLGAVMKLQKLFG